MRGFMVHANHQMMIILILTIPIRKDKLGQRH